MFIDFFNEPEEDRLYQTFGQITETAKIAKKLKKPQRGRAGSYYE